MLKIPKIRKKISAFLIEEDGKITKQSVLKTGAILTGAALSTLALSIDAEAGHIDSLTNFNCKEDTVTAGHSDSHDQHEEGGM